MRRLTCLLTALALAGAGLAAAGSAQAATTTVRSVTAGHYLNPGQVLVSPNGRYHAAIVRSSGRLLVARRDGTLALVDAGHPPRRAPARRQARQRPHPDPVADLLADGVQRLEHATTCCGWATTACSR